MYKNILLPVLLSDENPPLDAYAAVKALADTDAKITLFHVIEELPGYANIYVADDFLELNVTSVNVRLAEMARAIDGAHPVVVQGHPARSILKYAEENSCDCIIISSHTPGVQDYFLGGTAARVVRYAKCAVHVLR